MRDGSWFNTRGSGRGKNLLVFTINGLLSAGVCYSFFSAYSDAANKRNQKHGTTYAPFFIVTAADCIIAPAAYTLFFNGMRQENLLPNWKISRDAYFFDMELAVGYTILHESLALITAYKIAQNIKPTHENEQKNTLLKYAMPWLRYKGAHLVTTSLLHTLSSILPSENYVIPMVLSPIIADAIVFGYYMHKVNTAKQNDNENKKMVN